MTTVLPESRPTRSHRRSHLDAHHFEIFGTGISECGKDHSRSDFGVDGWWDLTPENREKILRVLRNCALLTRCGKIAIHSTHRMVIQPFGKENKSIHQTTSVISTVTSTSVRQGRLTLSPLPPAINTQCGPLCPAALCIPSAESNATPRVGPRGDQDPTTVQSILLPWFV
jgi:hypothetical protein